MSMFFRISSFYFFYFSFVAIYIVFLPKILSLLAYSSFHIGVIFSLGPLMRFLIPFLFLKKYNLNNKVFHMSLILILISTVLFYISIQNFYFFIIPNILLGIAFGVALPYVEAYAIGFLKKELYGKSRLFGSLGFMLCSILLARNLSDYTVGLNYFLASSVLIVFFGFYISSEKNMFRSKPKQIYEKFKFRKTLYFWISIFFMQMSMGVFYNFFTIYETDHGISLKTVSYLWTFSIISEMALFYFQSKFFKRFGLITLVKFAVFMTIIRWLLLFAFPYSLMISYISQSLHAFSFALHHTASITYLYGKYENKKLSNQFYYGISFGLGGFLGSLLAGYLYGRYIFLYAALIALVSLLVLTFGKPRVLKQNS